MIVEITNRECAWPPAIENLQKCVPTPFLIMIGTGSQEEMDAALNLKAEAFLAKPVEPKLLAMAFRQVRKRLELESQVERCKSGQIEFNKNWKSRCSVKRKPLPRRI